MCRIFALSDLHIDTPQNMQFMLNLSDCDYSNDTLVIAGDVSDDLTKIETVFSTLLKKFYRVAYVPGNHELWIRKTHHQDSIEKFWGIHSLCQQLGIATDAIKIEGTNNSAWLVPLFSWYRMPEEGRESLFIHKEGENWQACGWVDHLLCRWPEAIQQDHVSVADYFYSLNIKRIQQTYDAPIISFSHFLPRKELIFPSIELAQEYCTDGALIAPHPKDPHPQFNFSRVAGCHSIDRQIRELGSSLHIYGHQHRNRCREISGVTYLSHCLGNLREQRSLAYDLSPRLVWDDGVFVQAEDRYVAVN